MDSRFHLAAKGNSGKMDLNTIRDLKAYFLHQIIAYPPATSIDSNKKENEKKFIR